MKRKNIRTGSPDSLALVAAYVAALSAGQNEKLTSLRSSDFVMDLVHSDAFEGKPLTLAETKAFWPAWFAAFPERDYEVTRTIAGKDVVVTQWVFTGTHTKTLNPPILDEPLPPSGRTVRFRGVTIYDVDTGKGENGLINRETTYMDLATIIVELGVTP